MDLEEVPPQPSQEHVLVEGIEEGDEMEMEQYPSCHDTCLCHDDDVDDDDNKSNPTTTAIRRDGGEHPGITTRCSRRVRREEGMMMHDQLQHLHRRQHNSSSSSHPVHLSHRNNNYYYYYIYNNNHKKNRTHIMQLLILLCTCFILTTTTLLCITTSMTEAAFTNSNYNNNMNNVWQEIPSPKIRIERLPVGDCQIFRGNSSHEDHFKLLHQDGESLLVGARNIVYNISLASLEQNRRLEWYSQDEDVKLCRLKGKSEDDCHNYIRVLAKKSEDTLLVCGTNSFKPRCRDYVVHTNRGGSGDSDFEVMREEAGEGLCPYDPHHNSTAVFADGNLYVATVAQFSGADPLIYRSPLRTGQFNPKHLNQPNFVKSLSSDEHVYFFLRETAVEYMNCGKRVYSRVARVCTKDKGGPHKFRDHWTSFVKARLNCSIPGDFPFYFDEIQSTSNFVKGTYSGRSQQIVYGVFTTPSNSLGASAICAFKMDDIQAAFDGQFKGQEASNSNWLPVPSFKVPEPRPGKCVNDSRSLPEATLNFIKDHPLMDQAVPNFWGQPLFVHPTFNFKFTQIAVDPQIETVSGKTYDVLFIGTDDGRVLKVINSASASPVGHHLHNRVVPVVIEEVRVFDKERKIAISNLLVYHTFYEAKLLVVSSSEIQAIPLHKCQAHASTCGKCVALQDPYCAWDLSRQVCTSSRSRFWNRENFVQNIEDGQDPRCPDRPPFSSQVDTSNEVSPVNPGLSDRLNPEITPVNMYTLETFALVVVTSVVASFVTGFILGYIFSRRCGKHGPSHTHGRFHPGHAALGYGPYGMSSDVTGYTDYQLHHPVHHSDHYATQIALGHQSPVNGVGVGAYNGSGIIVGGGGGGGPPVSYSGNTGTLISSGASHHQQHNNSVNNKPINLVLNVPPTSHKNGKNANSAADNKPLMQKVKKIYL